MSGPAAWAPATGGKAFPVEEGRPGRGDGPEPVAAVLIAEPHRVGGQALGGGVGRKGAVAVAHQAGGGADPQSARCILEQVVDGIALELRGILGVEGDKVDAVEADQASVGAQPQIAVAGLQDGVDGVLRQAGIGAPGLVAVVVERPLGIERHGGMLNASSKAHNPAPLPGSPDHSLQFAPDGCRFHNAMPPIQARLEHFRCDSRLAATSTSRSLSRHRIAGRLKKGARVRALGE